MSSRTRGQNVNKNGGKDSAEGTIKLFSSLVNRTFSLERQSEAWQSLCLFYLSVGDMLSQQGTQDKAYLHQIRLRKQT